jgi:RimJ/RimL family protein N-acetyltransferase
MIKSISDIILAYKGNTIPAKRFTIPVVNQDGDRIGLLACFDRELCNDLNLISSLTAWRRQYMHFFLTQFNATEVRTQSWLEHVVIPSPNRIFFVIYLLTNEAIGNFGVCNMTEVSGELDNLIRGHEGGAKGLIYYCELAILSWMFGELGYKTSNLHVFSNNLQTIKLHSSVGFSIISSIRLYKKMAPELTEYLTNPDGGDLVDFNYLEMQMDKSFFLDKYPWIQNVYAEHWQ